MPFTVFLRRTLIASIALAAGACGGRSELDGLEVPPPLLCCPELDEGGISDGADADSYDASEDAFDAAAIDQGDATSPPDAQVGPPDAPPIVCDELVSNGDFSTASVGFVTAYDVVADIASEGQLTLGPNPATSSVYGWASFGDHTTGTGLMLLANAATTSSSPVWSESISVVAGVRYTFSFWATNVDPTQSSTSSGLASLAPVIDAQAASPTTVSFTAGDWIQISTSWVAPATTTIDVAILDTDLAATNNDFAIDDVSVRCSP